MANKLGISTHLQKFQQTQLSPAQAPNLSLLTSLKSLNQIIKSKRQSIDTEMNARSHIQKILTYQQAKQLKQSKQSIKQNQLMLKFIQICREIDIAIVRFQDDIQVVDFDQFHKLKERLRDFKNIYMLIQKLDSQFNSLYRYEQDNQNKKRSNKNNDYNIINGNRQQKYAEKQSQCEMLKMQYFIQLKTKLQKAIVQIYYSSKRIRKLQQSLQYFKLPIKKINANPNKNANNSSNVNSNKNANIAINSTVMVQQVNQFNKEDQMYKNYCYCILEALFCQYSYYCLQKKIEMIFGDQLQNQEQKTQPSLSITQSKKINSKSFISLFFTKLWYKPGQSLMYIFINSPNMNLQSNVYQIDEPNWMFEYMQQIFRDNYRFISQNILSVLKKQNETKQIIQYIQTYFIAYNIKSFFLKFIIMRLQSDIKYLKQEQKSEKKGNKQQKDRSAFIIFNFLDELHILSQKIYDHYQYQSNLLECVLQWAQKNSSLNILAYNFDYEHNWIQDRIFNDFANINYSIITNLKNVEAYNITVNFIHMFEKLYSKFRKILDQNLKSKINQFYYQKLLQLVRHIKTSFERIYNYSEVDKYQTLISYKKVQDQFRAYFGQFIHQSPILQQKINSQYYSVLEKYTSVLALQKLTNIHKQMYKRLSDNNELFTKQISQTNEQASLNNNKKKWNQIFQQWKEKMNKISKLHPNYQDKKLRNIFFVFLQSIQFSEDGFYYFLSNFQPFLIAMFSLQGANTIKILLDMEKGALKQYCKTHQNSLWFLTSNQIKSIQKVKIGKPKLN